MKNDFIKIDTGCPYTSIPVKKLGISNEKARFLKQIDALNLNIEKKISFISLIKIAIM
jgi:hypothetical protein